MDRIYNIQATSLVQMIMDLYTKDISYMLGSFEDVEKHLGVEKDFLKTCIDENDTPTLLAVCRDFELIEKFFGDILASQYNQNKVTILIDKLMRSCNIRYFKHLANKLNIKTDDILRWERKDDIDSFIAALKFFSPDIYSSILKNESYGENIMLNSYILQQAKEEANKYGLDTAVYIENLITNDLKYKVVK